MSNSKMYKFNPTRICRQQPTAVVGRGYWNTCYVDEVIHRSESITHLQHGRTLPDQGGLPNRYVLHRCDVYTEWKDKLGDTENGEVNKIRGQRYEVHIDNIANEKSVESVQCTQIKALRNDKCSLRDKPEDDDGDFPDGGWGYVVLLGCFVTALLAAIMGPCFGIMFSKFLLEMETPSAMVAWIYNSENFIWSISVLLMSPMVKMLGFRKLVFAGGLLSSLGMGISAFAPSASFLVFSYSLIAGFGHGMSCLGMTVIIPQYFKRRRGRAYAVMNAGVCTGQMLGPILISHLLQEYGFTGAVLIVAAMLLNICVAACVFQPVEWHTTRQKADRNTMNDHPLDNDSASGCGVTLLRTIRTLVSSFRMLASLRLLIIVMGASLNMSGYLTFFSMLPFIMADDGYSHEEVSWCMSVSGVCNLVTRVVVTTLADWPRFSKRGCFMAGTATIALSVSEFGPA